MENTHISRLHVLVAKCTIFFLLHVNAVIKLYYLYVIYLASRVHNIQHAGISINLNPFPLVL
jgi:hypothetical protein